VNPGLRATVSGDEFPGNFLHGEADVTVTPVDRRSRSKTAASASDGLIAYCARPRCRGEFRRKTVAGRPARYCSDECLQKARTERRSAEARARHAEDLLRQARVDLDAFDADDAVASLGGDQQGRLQVALGQARTALRYVGTEGAGLAELQELVAAATAVLETRSSTSVA